MSDVNIEINGIPLQVPSGTMLIEAADNVGITIPRFCYHKKLSVAANCRMCLVEVEKAPKPLPACATPVTDGMKVFTQSERAIEAQKSVMEFLLINHPLDCPICDQGGECDLQDIAMGYGKDVSRFSEKKRVVPNKNIGPLIATDMTRCIHCTRCVRFGQEIGGIMELGAYGRGEDTRIGTYMESAVSSEMSGNVIDLCPVGALTSKPYRYRGRPWENQQRDSIAAHDCVGSNLDIEVRRNTVMRVLPKENEAINEVWISDRDRFSYTALYDEQRASHALIKQGDEWKQVDWQIALDYAVEGIRTVQKQNTGKIGALTSYSATLEEMYLLQKLLRGLGSHNIDHRLRQLDFRNQETMPRYPSLGTSIAELEQLDAGLLIGACIRKDQPILAHRLRKAALDGASIMSVNAIEYDVNFPLAESIVTAPSEMPLALAGIAKALLTLSGESAPAELAAELENITTCDDHLAMARHLYSAEKAAVLLGIQGMGQHEFSELQALGSLIARLSGASFGYLSDGANSAGAWLAGAVPHRQAGGGAVAEAGLHAGEMLSQAMGAMLLLHVEPEFDSAYGAEALKAIDTTDFVVCLTPFVSDSLKHCCDVILPVTPFTEMSGTLVNIEGHWQSFSAAVNPLQEAKPAWKVLRVLGNLFELDGFEQVTSEEVRDELKQLTVETPKSDQGQWHPPAVRSADSHLQRIGHLPVYAVDSLVRRARPLQDTADAIAAAAYMNEQTALDNGILEADSVLVRQDGGEARLPLVIDEAVPAHCILIPYGVPGSETLGLAYGPIELQQD
ncbi:NADH-quinone oxidoreductase subunit NuoG [Thiohalophilus sp.]|uniref:NADH-quinone oxidoreductase subunit NuoG n=1 Tax=Thiohalophilus sp. TaxID=3028392 RepID=UPI00397582D2